MALSALDVAEFRSLRKARFEFDRNANYLFGPNGSGKTSVLEAVFYAATGRSFRTRRDGELLRFGSDCLTVVAEDEQGRVGRLVFDGREKRFELEGRQLTRLSEFFGWLPVVPLLLSDVELVAGPPGRRRDFLDMAGAKADRAHIRLINDYRRVLTQYNRLLVSGRPGGQLEAWEAELARHGTALTRARAEIARLLLTRAGELSGGLVGRAAEYRFRCGGGDWADSGCDEPAGPGTGTAINAEVVREALARSRKRAVESGHAVVGPHRDDVLISMDRRSLRRFGSVGEQRAAATALRLAEADFLRRRTGQPAVFLMDEVASELDAERSAALFEQTGRAGQILYAAARPFPVQGRVFILGNGEIR